MNKFMRNLKMDSYRKFHKDRLLLCFVILIKEKFSSVCLGLAKRNTSLYKERSMLLIGSKQHIRHTDLCIKQIDC